jgi:hypothetical protein
MDDHCGTAPNVYLLIIFELRHYALELNNIPSFVNIVVHISLNLMRFYNVLSQ